MNLMLVYPAIITWLALALYFYLTYNVGRARAKHKIAPPKTTGPEEFERYWRVQQNTLEQLMLFLPALWLFSIYLSPVWGALIGLVWVFARLMYAMGYYQDAAKRMPGFVAGLVAVVLLMIGSIYGMLRVVSII